jgi:hypothetical protein
MNEPHEADNKTNKHSDTIYTYFISYLTYLDQVILKSSQNLLTLDFDYVNPFVLIQQFMLTHTTIFTVHC